MMLRPRRRQTKVHYGLQESELNQLATYNAEISRGLLHTQEWREQMAQLQDCFNQNVQELRRREWRDQTRQQL